MSWDSDPIQQPSAAAAPPVSGRGSFGSVERALSGDFDFGIGETMSEAWALTRGSKGVIIGGYTFAYLITAVLGVMGYLINPPEAAETASTGQMAAGALFQLAATLLSYPIFAGIYLYAVKRAAGDSGAGFGDVIAGIPFLIPLIGLYLLQILFIFLGLALLILPGIYLMVGYSLAVPVLLEKQVGVWQSLEISRQGVGHAWFRFLGLMFAVGVIVMFGMLLTLGIGAIWLIPWATLCFGVAYRKVFGYGASA
jgi:hypothetical protein